MTNTHARPTWPVAAASQPGWGPSSGPVLPDLPPPPDPGWERASAPPPAPPGWVPPPPTVPRAPVLPPAPPTLPPAPPEGPGSSEAPPSEPPRSPVGLQNLLLGLGTALVAVSVVVFTAVNWNRLDASVQGLVLVALTIAAGAASVVAARREMPASAEAIGLVAVLMALADVHAVRVGLAPAAEPAAFWAGGFAAAAVLAAVLGRLAGTRGPRIAAGLLGQFPLLCALVAADASLGQAQLAVVAQAAAVLLLAHRIDVGRWVRRVASAWALFVASILTLALVVDSTVGGWFSDADVDLHRPMTGLGLVAFAVLAALVAWIQTESADVRWIALAVATSSALAAVWFGSIDAVHPQTAVALVALVSATVVLVGRRAPKVWGAAPAGIALVIGGLAVLPLLGAVGSILTAASTVAADAWHRSGSTAASTLQIEGSTSYSSIALALQVAAVAIGVVAFARRGAALALGTAAAVVGLLALALSPLLVPLTITGTVAIALAAVVLGVVVAAVLGARHPGFGVAVGFAVLAYTWATPWSLATSGLTFLTLGSGIAGAVVLAAVARGDGSVPAAVAATAWVVVATPLLVGLAVWDGGASVAMGWAAASVAVVVLSIAGVVLLDPRGTASVVSAAMREAVEWAALIGYLGALVGTVCQADPGSASVALAAGTVGFALHAVRPGRQLLGLAAAAEGLALVWLQLQQADVATVEAYTLPLAAVLLLIGLLASRSHHDEGELPSWVSFGPALVVGLAPTVWLSFTEPGSIRPLAGLVAGALVLVAGVVRGRRAFVDVGTATVAALGLEQLAPVVGEIPNWATIGATGVVLIAVGATFEQRRRDLKAVLRAYSALS